MLSDYVYIKRGSYRKYLYIVPLVISIIIGILVATSFNTDKVKYFFITFICSFILLHLSLYAFTSFAKLKEKNGVLYFTRIRSLVWNIIVSLITSLIVSIIINIVFNPINKAYLYTKFLLLVAILVFITILIYSTVAKITKIKE